MMTSKRDTSAPVEAERGVRATVDAVYAAWAHNDADAFVAPYAATATAVLPGSYLPNRDAIHATMTAVFDGVLKGSRAVYEVQDIRFINSDTAIMISKGAVVPAGQTRPTPDSQSLDTWVLSQRDGTWRVEAFHSCPENAA